MNIIENMFRTIQFKIFFKHKVNQYGFFTFFWQYNKLQKFDLIRKLILKEYLTLYFIYLVCDQLERYTLSKQALVSGPYYFILTIEYMYKKIF